MKSMRDSVGVFATLCCCLTAIGLTVVPLRGAEGVQFNRESDQWGAALPAGVLSSGQVFRGALGLVTVVYTNTTPSGGAGGPPPLAAANDLLAASLFAGDVFQGDFTQIDSIAFKLKTSVVFPYVVSNPVVRLELITPSAQPIGYSAWSYRRLQPPTQADTWTIYQIPMRLDAGWTNDYWAIQDGINLSDKWNEELVNVTNVTVRTAKQGLFEQSFSVDRFILVGSDFASPAGRLVELGDALRDRFGKTRLDELSELDREADTDKDGMSDVNEIVAGSDWNDANSAFKVEVVEMGAGGVTIRWTCVPGGIYTVKRADGIGSSFPFVDRPDGIGLTAGAETVMTYTDTDATGVGPYFYKIVRD